MNTKRIPTLKIIIIIYLFIGALVAMVVGLTRDTIDKIGTQEVWDDIISIKKALRTKDNKLYICYLGDRGKEKKIELWAEVSIADWKNGKRKPYYHIALDDLV